VIIVEGLFVLNEKLSKCGGIKVFIRTDCHGRFVRRVTRDISRTCWEPSKILGYFLEIVDPLHKKYIDPQEFAADFVIVNQYNPISEPGKSCCQKERQIKIEIEGPLPVKTLSNAGAEYVSHTNQQDVYFSIPGKKETELLRIRGEEGSVLFTYKAPQCKGGVRLKHKVEFPITPVEQGTIQASCKEELKVFKSRDLFILDGTVFSQDCIITPGKPNRHFIEVRGDLKEAKVVLKKLNLSGLDILKESYFEILA